MIKQQDFEVRLDNCGNMPRQIMVMFLMKARSAFVKTMQTEWKTEVSYISPMANKSWSAEDVLWQRFNVDHKNRAKYRIVYGTQNDFTVTQGEEGKSS